MGLPSDMSPDPSTPIDLVQNDSSPEPQRNSNFHVVKKTKPKRKKKTKNKKKKKKMKIMMEMEPEDCTIRHDEDTKTIGNKITKTLASMRMSPKPNSKPTNPFDMLDENDEENEESISVSISEKLDSTNPFADEIKIKRTKSTNPFMDLP